MRSSTGRWYSRGRSRHPPTRVGYPHAGAHGGIQGARGAQNRPTFAFANARPIPAQVAVPGGLKEYKIALETEIGEKLDEGEVIITNSGARMTKFPWCPRFNKMYEAHSWECQKPPCCVLGLDWEMPCRPAVGGGSS